MLLITGTTPLLLCASKGYSEVANLLISSGADVNIATNDGYSPLFAASREDRADITLELLAAGSWNCK